MNVTNRSRPEPLPESSVFRLPDYLHSQYENLIVISHRRHLAELNLNDETTLIVSTDWLAWRQAVETKAHCIHFEAVLDRWVEERGDPQTHHLRVCEWVYDDAGKDMTIFQGVSLGKYFVRDVTLFANAFCRIWYAIERIVLRFRPSNLFLLDLRAEYNLIDPAVRDHLCRSVARKHGLRYEKREELPGSGNGGYSERDDGHGAPSPDPTWRVILRTAYAKAIDIIFRARWRLAGKPRCIFVYSNPLTMMGMITNYERGMSEMPLFLAGLLPKSPGFVASCLRIGIRLAHRRVPGLTRDDERELDRIEGAVRAKFAGLDSPHDKALGVFIESRMIKTGWFRDVAREVKSYLHFLAVNSVCRVVVGDVTGRPRLIAECAAALGIPADELPNGMFVVPQRNDARSGDRGRPPLLSRILTWGAQMERWLDLGQVIIEKTRTGYPALYPFYGVAARRHDRGIKKVLVLPIYMDGDDVMALASNVFSYLVDTIRVLNDAGAETIRIKIHSGPQDLDYYRDVVLASGVDCEVVKGGPILPHFEWADIVVGPVNSGAYIEANAAGVPFYGYRPWPSLIALSLFDGMDILETPDDLREALIEQRRPDRDVILAKVASVAQIPNPGRQTWYALSNVGQNAASSSSSFQQTV